MNINISSSQNHLQINPFQTAKPSSCLQCFVQVAVTTRHLFPEPTQLICS